MTLRTVKLPDVGEGVAEAEIVEWQVAEGDVVAEDQTLAAVMTDKATVEIPSPVSGKIVERGGEIGTILAVGSKLVTIEVIGTAGRADASAAVQQSPSESSDGEETPTRSPSPGISQTADETTAAPPLQAPDAPTVTATAKRLATDASDLHAKALASPAVRRRALDLGIDLRLVRGSGPAGRITHADLDGFQAEPKETLPRPQRREGTEEIRIVGLRRRIAERMAEATRNIAHFSYIEEIDVTALEALRADLNARHAGSRPKLTMLPFIVRALVVAVEEFPQMNALYEDDRQVVVRHSAVHVGIATQTASGLMVPVLRHAEEKSLWTCAGEIARLADAAREGSATREELSGSTITVTSLGNLGGIATTPVINRPEVAIVGVNRIAVRPVWQDGQFVPRKMMNLSSSFDHRVIDGQDAALFIQRVKGLLEIPATMFIGG